MSTIPASAIVNVNPGVLGTGGSALNLNGLILTTNIRVPIGTVMSFASQAAVAAFFGGSSTEATKAGIYFNGFDGSTVKPGAILFAQYNNVAVAAYLRGGNISQITLAALQAISGTLTVIMDGYVHVAGSVNLSAATSFSSAASIIQTALTASEPTEASVTASLGATFTGTQATTNLTTTAVTGLISVGDTIAGTGVAVGTKIVSQTSGTPGGAGVYVTDLSGTASSASCTASSNVLNVTVVGSGTVAIGQTITGSGVTPAVITALGTGTGGVGTYVISGSPQHVASESMTAVATAITVTYDSVSGAFIVTSGITGAPSTAAFATGTIAATLLLTQATGATLSQGSAAATPAAFMNALALVNQNWASFMTAFDPDGGSGNTLKLAFAAWVSGTNGRYCYVCWDTDTSPTVTVPATSSLGYLIAQAGYSGTALIYEPSDLNLAVFICGAIASIDFEQPNGRTTLAFRSQAGLTASVSDLTTSVNLGGNPQVVGDRGNGYNYYGAFATANQAFTFFQRGFVSGRFLWLDSYVNEIWLTNLFQLALTEFLANALSVPFNPAGRAAIEAALADPIQQGLSFGAYRAAVSLSVSQAAAVNAAAGANIAPTLATQGWYLQVPDVSTSVRQARGPQPITFWYVD